MADGLYELLLPHLTANGESIDEHGHSGTLDSTTRSYLERLTTLSAGALSSTEQESLTDAAQSSLRSLQALSKRSHGAITGSAGHLNDLINLVAATKSDSEEIRNTIKSLEEATSHFALRYERSTENTVLDKRKAAAQLSRNAERVGGILELPSLLSSTINSTAATDGGVTTTVASSAALSGYASALDIHAHVRRLKALYPHSGIVNGVSQEADEEVANMLTVLVTTLQSPNLKLAVAMRTIGWLRRVAPELAGLHNHTATLDRRPSLNISASQGSDEGSLGSLFLVCRLVTLRRTLEALEPLKELADQETSKRAEVTHQSLSWSGGMQSERYLKRFIEIFREQSFAIISMYRSIFPTALPMPETSVRDDGPDPTSKTGSRRKSTTTAGEDLVLEERASALAAFVPELVDMLATNLSTYMPNVSDRSSRDSLLSQVLFCAGSLGRLGADFGMMLAIIEEDLAEKRTGSDEPTEWVDVMKKHRVQASRLEVLASGVTAGRAAINMPSLDAQMQSTTAGTA